MTGWIVAALMLIACVAAWLRCRSLVKGGRMTLHEFLRGDEERAGRRRRVFEVLQRVSNAILAGEPDSALHRILTEGAASVAGAHGAILYLADEKSGALVPRHCTKDCPPLIELPERIIAQAQTNPHTVPSFLRLHSIAPDAGVLGDVFVSQKAQNVPDLQQHPKFAGPVNALQEGIAAVIAPFYYGTRKIGVIAAANTGGKAFTEHALEMFASLAEQGAFALGSAQAHKEAAEKRAIDQELQNASEIQRILLPEKAPEAPALEIFGHNIPARLVSGDYYDFFPIGNARFGIAIADVCGKGIAAALLTAMCRSVLRANARDAPSPSAALAAVNRNLFPDIRQDMFITASYLVAVADGAVITLARAGHTAPLVWRKKTGLVEEISAPGLVIGLDKGEVFERVTRDVTFTLESGDLILLYTDGVSEAADAKDRLFGEGRIKEILAQTAPQGPRPVVDAICREVKNFLGGEPQNDDITLLAVRRK